MTVVVAYIRWWIDSLGYWIRPYDMIADRRRWRWRAATRCTLIVPKLALIPNRSQTHAAKDTR